MTQGFDGWYKNNYWQLSADIDEAKDTYKAGAASRQAEIDELQKRIVDVLNTIEPSGDISHMLYRKVYKILKGESNE